MNKKDPLDPHNIYTENYINRVNIERNLFVLQRDIGFAADICYETNCILIHSESFQYIEYKAPFIIKSNRYKDVHIRIK